MNPLDDLVTAEASTMPTRSNIQFSPYRVFSREDWAKLRADTPMTLVPRDLEQLSGVIEELSMREVEQIYLPLSRLLNLHVRAVQSNGLGNLVADGEHRIQRGAGLLEDIGHPVSTNGAKLCRLHLHHVATFEQNLTADVLRWWLR